MKPNSAAIVFFAMTAFAVVRCRSTMETEVVVDDRRLAVATCQLRCLDKFGIRKIWPYADDPRGIYWPSITCPEESTTGHRRVALCQTCTDDCHVAKEPSPNARPRLALDGSLRLAKPSLHCRSWTPPSDPEEAAMDGDGGLAPMVYIKLNVLAAVSEGGEGGAGASDRPPVAFVLDIRRLEEAPDGWSEWTQMGVNTASVVPIFYLEPGRTYQWRAAAVTANRTLLPWVVSDPINATVGSGDRYFKPHPVTNARIHRWIRTGDPANKMNALLVWDPNPEFSCSQTVYFDVERGSRMRSWKSEVSTANLAVLDRMEFSGNYSFRIRALNPLAGAESDLHVLRVESPPCLQVYNNSFQFCPPPAPGDVRVLWRGDSLLVRWNLTDLATAENRIDSVSVNLVEELYPVTSANDLLAALRSYRSPKYGLTKKTDLPGDATSAAFEGLPKTSAYKVWVRAETAGGASDSAPVTVPPAVLPPPSPADEDVDRALQLSSADGGGPNRSPSSASSSSSSSWVPYSSSVAALVVLAAVVCGVVLYVAKCRRCRRRGSLVDAAVRGSSRRRPDSAASSSTVAGGKPLFPPSFGNKNGAGDALLAVRQIRNDVSGDRRPRPPLVIRTSHGFDDGDGKCGSGSGGGGKMRKWFSFRKPARNGSSDCTSPGTDVTDASGSSGGSVFSGYLRPNGGGQNNRQTLRFFGENVILTSAMSLSPPDDYEVSWDQVILQEVLGEGAFGVVRKAQLRLSPENRAKLAQKQAPLKSAAAATTTTMGKKNDKKKNIGDDNWRDGRKGNGVVFETVAVKMLKDGAGLEEYQQLKNEMEVLKMMRHHPNVVGMLGAITQSRPMALIVQHCPYGDLHTQLRRLAEDMERAESDRRAREEREAASKGIVYASFDTLVSTEDLTSSDGGRTETAECVAISTATVVGGNSRRSVLSMGFASASAAAAAAVHNEMYNGDVDVEAADKRGGCRQSRSCEGAARRIPAAAGDGRDDDECCERRSSTDGHPSSSSSAASPVTTSARKLNNNNNNDNEDENHANKERRCGEQSEDEMRTPADLLSIARQIASGMDYLAKNKVVHRDLAARNILLYEPKHIKISDFGLSRDVYARNLYERTSNGKVPIRWMAPESILHQVYTTKSDVWSFGILLWEIATLGGVPYPGIAPGNLYGLLQQGYKMPKPNNCSSDLYKLMLACWQLGSADRPSFTELKEKLDKMLEDSSSEQYLTLHADPVIPRVETD